MCRKNEAQKTTPQKIVVAKGGDMAYEYSTLRLRFDDNTGHQERSGALLRVWQNEGGVWKAAAIFQRPYGEVQPNAAK